MPTGMDAVSTSRTIKSVARGFTAPDEPDGIRTSEACGVRHNPCGALEPMAVSSPSQRRTLLLVDDEPDILDSVSTVLEWGIPGLDVVTALSGKAGLAILDRRPVDLIVSDFKMPNMDGLEFLYQCGLKHPRTPRAILTAFLTDDL